MLDVIGLLFAIFSLGTVGLKLDNILHTNVWPFLFLCISKKEKASEALYIKLLVNHSSMVIWMVKLVQLT